MSMSAGTVLERILAETRAEVERRKREQPLPTGASDQAVAADTPMDTHMDTPMDAPATDASSPAPRARRARLFQEALRGEGVGVIAEFKRRSPSAGALHEDPDLAQIVSAYERGGAVALSILTEGPNFGGALDDLRAARAVSELPLLRKDFVVDGYQLYEAVAAGADAVLLIVAALTAPELGLLHRQARELGLDALVEVHDHAELLRALELGADIVGINNRDLRDFSVDLERTELLLDEIPAGVTIVSESGIAGPEQVRRLRERGVHAVLVGESLMRSNEPAATLRALTSVASNRI
jgi:indole-3-glycerol phosphate synthase